jgi:hypothetical protein
LLSCHADKLTDDGRRRLVRHGHLPEREIMTGIGPIAVRCPRVRDRGGEGSERIRFLSTILPPYARRSKSPSRSAFRSRGLAWRRRLLKRRRNDRAASGFRGAAAEQPDRNEKPEKIQSSA